MIELNKNDLLLVAGGFNSKYAAEIVAIGILGVWCNPTLAPSIIVVCGVGFIELVWLGFRW